MESQDNYWLKLAQELEPATAGSSELLPLQQTVREGVMQGSYMPWGLCYHLQHKGYEANVCTSRDQFKQIYHVIEVYIDGERHIVDTNLRDELAIGGAADEYKALLTKVPEMFVGTAKQLSIILNVMGRAMIRSFWIKRMELPDWRTPEYLLNKWLGHYCPVPVRITTQELPKPLMRKSLLTEELICAN